MDDYQLSRFDGYLGQPIFSRNGLFSAVTLVRADDIEQDDREQDEEQLGMVDQVRILPFIEAQVAFTLKMNSNDIYYVLFNGIIVKVSSFDIITGNDRSRIVYQIDFDFVKVVAPSLHSEDHEIYILSSDGTVHAVLLGYENPIHRLINHNWDQSSIVHRVRDIIPVNTTNVGEFLPYHLIVVYENDLIGLLKVEVNTDPNTGITESSFFVFAKYRVAELAQIRKVLLLGSLSVVITYNSIDRSTGQVFIMQLGQFDHDVDDLLDFIVNPQMLERLPAMRIEPIEGTTELILYRVDGLRGLIDLQVESVTGEGEEFYAYYYLHYDGELRVSEVNPRGGMVEMTRQLFGIREIAIFEDYGGDEARSLSLAINSNDQLLLLNTDLPITFDSERNVNIYGLSFLTSMERHALGQIITKSSIF